MKIFTRSSALLLATSVSSAIAAPIGVTFTGSGAVGFVIGTDPLDRNAPFLTQAIGHYSDTGSSTLENNILTLNYLNTYSLTAGLGPELTGTLTINLATNTAIFQNNTCTSFNIPDPCDFPGFTTPNPVTEFSWNKINNTIIFSSSDIDEGTGATVFTDFTIEVSEVPIPPAIWLFGSAVIGIASKTYKRKA